MTDGDPRAAAELPTPSTAWVTLMGGLGWVAALPQLWAALATCRRSRFGVTRWARLALLATVSSCIGCAISQGDIAWGVGIYASLLASVSLLGWWFVSLTRPSTSLRRKAWLFSAAWVVLLLLVPLLAWIELTLLHQMGLYVLPLALLAAPLMAWTGLHGQAIAEAAPKASRNTVEDWRWKRGLRSPQGKSHDRGDTWGAEGCTLQVSIDDTRSPTRTTIWAKPRHEIEDLSLRRGKDTRLNDVILNECLQSMGDPEIADRVLAGHHEAFLPPLHGHGFRIESGRVHATIDGNPSRDILDAAWKLVLALEARGKEVR